ncbi:MAG: hypothetical protein ABH817_00225 [archaeon]
MMIKNFVIFKNPNLRYRKEDFGGIVKLTLKTLIINKQQYELIEKIKKIMIYSDLDDFEIKIADKLIENGVFLKIDLNRAKELGFKY